MFGKRNSSPTPKGARSTHPVFRSGNEQAWYAFNQQLDVVDSHAAAYIDLIDGRQVNESARRAIRAAHQHAEED